MEYKMFLTDEEKDILNGSKGEVMAKVAKSVVMYGEVLMQSDWCGNRSVSSCNQFRNILNESRICDYG